MGYVLLFNYQFWFCNFFFFIYNSTSRFSISCNAYELYLCTYNNNDNIINYELCFEYISYCVLLLYNKILNFQIKYINLVE